VQGKDEMETGQVTRQDYDALVQTAELSPKERRIVVDILNTSETAEQLIPDTIAPEDLWEKLSATAKALERIGRAISRLKPFLGRMLIVLQKYPDLYKDLGYPNFNEFMTRGCEELFGVSRSEAFACKRIAEVFGNALTPGQMEEIGLSKLSIAATAVKKRIDDGMPQEIKDKQINYWVEAAKTDTFFGLKERIADQGLVDAGELEMKSLVLYLREEVREQFLEFRRNPWVVSTAGAGTDSAVLLRMMEECSSWQSEWEQSLRQRASET
jgi:hypothetical protein